MDRARAKAEEFSGVKAVSVDQLLVDPEIDIVVNLTIPCPRLIPAAEKIQKIIDNLSGSS